MASNPALVASSESVMRPGTWTSDRVGLSWLITVRWVTVAACALAVLAGERALDVSVPIAAGTIPVALVAASNVWLWSWIRRGQRPTARLVAGLLVSTDVVLLSGLLLLSGGVLNPASVFYLVQIVMVALVLGPVWTGVVTGLSVGGYALLFLGQTDALRAAQAMHPAIALHMRGMWLAFALTALLIGILVARLAVAVERGDRALEALRERNARASRLASLTTAVAGAAHELGTPLSTIAVAAHELEQALESRGAEDDLIGDARLIHAEIERCRALLHGMAGRVAAPLGEAPRAVDLREVLDAALRLLRPADATRVRISAAGEGPVMWPASVVAQAIANVLRNAFQASAPGSVVALGTSAEAGPAVRIVIEDRGTGMSAAVLARAGEPFFTTKAAGEGTGLGLFVTRSAIEQLGGTLEIASMPDRGTTATIRLPRDVVQS